MNLLDYFFKESWRESGLPHQPQKYQCPQVHHHPPLAVVDPADMVNTFKSY
ncbi:Hypothetical protein FKW44_004711 [Caligus rogercresseyi]|uniref:Uncharacterized protein n=1 Tax=Caligus rogercresseyi TaxID=217165 RepID=A0A7T8HLZ8_CALRO|nr:Hypothetical protein FKW44_004711 [Caligus rogercresseyi]